jgi:DNA-binding IclR family transcriptional regulator
MDKAFAIIEAVVARQATGLSFSEVQTSTGFPKASTYRILKDLTRLGYLSFSTETKKYRGSLRLAALGAEVMGNFDLRNHVHPHLLKLHEETRHTSNMGIRNGDVGVFADKIQSEDYGIKLFSEVGKIFPLHCTGLGKTLLAYSPEREVERILSRRLEAFTDRTITAAHLLKKELLQVRKDGYAVDREEITRGIICVAAPVFGVKGEIVCAISIAFPSYLNEDRGIEPEIEAIRRHASSISGSLLSQTSLSS